MGTWGCVGRVSQTLDPSWATEYKNREWKHPPLQYDSHIHVVLWMLCCCLLFQEEVLRQHSGDAGCVCHHSPQGGAADGTQWDVPTCAHNGLEHMCLHYSGHRYGQTTFYSFPLSPFMGFFFRFSNCLRVFTENILQEEDKPLFGSLQNRQVGCHILMNIDLWVIACDVQWSVFSFMSCFSIFSLQVWRQLFSFQHLRDLRALRLSSRGISPTCWGVRIHHIYLSVGCECTALSFHTEHIVFFLQCLRCAACCISLH